MAVQTCNEEIKLKLHCLAERWIRNMNVEPAYRTCDIVSVDNILVALVFVPRFVKHRGWWKWYIV